MENVKVWNKKYADRGMKFGETSRSDFLEEEKKTLGERIPISASDHQKRATNSNSFPQPRVAVELGHTADNVCIVFIPSTCFVIIGWSFMACVPLRSGSN